MRFVINKIPRENSKKKGAISFPDDYPHLKGTGKAFVAWVESPGVIQVETLLTGDGLKRELNALRRQYGPAAFEEYLTEKGDLIDNAAYALALALVRKNLFDEDEALLPWDMNFIAEISEAAEDILRQKGFLPCHPYYESTEEGEETPCYYTDSCKDPCCPFKTISG